MKKITILVFGLCAIATIRGQENPFVDITPTGVVKKDFPALKSIVYTVGFGMPSISSDLLPGDGIWDNNTGLAFQIGVDFRKQFTTERSMNNRVFDYPTLFAIGGGLGFSYFGQSSGLKLSEESINGNDKDNDEYIARLSYRDVKEQVSLLYLDIPLYLEIGKPSKTITRAWAKIGVKGSLLLNGNFKGEGQYASTGYYPKWDVELHDIPVLDYYPNKACYENPEYKLNPFVLWGNLSAGVSIPLSNPEKYILRNTILRIGLKYDFTLNTISSGSSTDLYPGSNYRINQSNMLGGNGARLQCFGLEIGLISSL